MSNYIFENENWGGAKCSLTEDGVLTINTEEKNVVVETEINVSELVITPWHFISDIVKLVEIKGHISFKKDSGLNGLFSNLVGCQSIDGLENLDVTEVVNMKGMFQNYTGLISLNISNWNTSKVIDMSYMFFDCSHLTKLDISNFDTSNVTNMAGMFDQCSSLTSLDLSNWNTSKVDNVENIFNGCSSLTSIITPKEFGDNEKFTTVCYNLCKKWYDIRNIELINSDNVETVMLYRSNAETAIDLNLWNNNKPGDSCYWKLNGTTLTIYSMGNNTVGYNSTTLRDQPGVMGDIPYITKVSIRGSTITFKNSNTQPFNNSADLSNLFANCSSCTSIEGLNCFDLTNVDDISKMFYNCAKLQTLNLSSWDLKNKTWDLTDKTVTDMFYGLDLLYYIITPKSFDTSFQKELYSKYPNLNEIGVKVNSSTKIKPNTLYFTKPLRWSNSLTNSCYWSYDKNNSTLTVYSDETNNKANNASELKNNFTTTNGIKLVEPSKVKQVKIEGHIKFVEETNLSQLFYNFYNCESFNGLENLDVSNVTNMSSMFQNCSGLTSLSVSNFDTSNVSDMSYAFYSCSQLKELNLNSFNLKNIASIDNITGMLQYLNNLETIITPYQFDFSGLFQAEFTTNLQDRKLKECDTGKLVDDTTIIKPSFIYTNNETLISNTRELSNNIVNVLN